MAEWLRRWTRNPMGSPRAGSNPARSDKILEYPNVPAKGKMRGPSIESSLKIAQMVIEFE